MLSQKTVKQAILEYFHIWRFSSRQLTNGGVGINTVGGSIQGLIPETLFCNKL